MQHFPLNATHCLQLSANTGAFCFDLSSSDIAAGPVCTAGASNHRSECLARTMVKSTFQSHRNQYKQGAIHSGKLNCNFLHFLSSKNTSPLRSTSSQSAKKHKPCLPKLKPPIEKNWKWLWLDMNDMDEFEPRWNADWKLTTTMMFKSLACDHEPPCHSKPPCHGTTWTTMHETIMPTTCHVTTWTTMYNNHGTTWTTMH